MAFRNITWFFRSKRRTTHNVVLKASLITYSGKPNECIDFIEVVTLLVNQGITKSPEQKCKNLQHARSYRQST